MLERRQAAEQTEGKTMKNKIIVVGAMSIALILAAQALAEESRGDNQPEDGDQPQIQVAGQGEDGAVRTQNMEGAEVKEAKEPEDQDAEDQSDGEEDDLGNATSSEGLKRRSAVANAVQALLEAASSTGGIGEQVRLIARKQNGDHDRIEASLEKVRSRNQILRAIIGPDYKEIKKAKEALAQNEARIEQLNQIKEGLAAAAEKQAVESKIKILDLANQTVSTTLASAENAFSLLGWLFRLFAR